MTNDQWQMTKDDDDLIIRWEKIWWGSAEEVKLVTQQRALRVEFASIDDDDDDDAHDDDE